jgi:hypothetical protein
MLGKGPLGGELFAGKQQVVFDIVSDTFIEVLV